MKINIAIDGPSAAGKSTIAKRLAKALGYSHLDTGAMYRCVGYLAAQRGIDLHDEDALTEMTASMRIRFDSEGHVFLNEEDVSAAIRENRVSMLASSVSVHPRVRKLLVDMQRQMALDKGVIMDGRDIGTVVLPDAELKIFMVASVEARARRRYQEYLDKHIEADYDTICEDIKKRDDQDMHRAASPLTKAADAHEIDTSDMSIEEVCAAILSLVEKTIV
ncbi:MAG: (d)CMP kinase [Merdibacter sp.]|nr:(d)CMP kinase [Candidatus Merdibacter merdipullorum]